MPTQVALVLSDGESTPVAHTFAVDGVLPNGVRSWREFDAVNPTATKYLTMLGTPSPARPSEAQIPGREVPTRKVDIKLTWPITFVDSASGLTLLDYVLTGKVNLSASPRAAPQKIKNLRFVLGNLLLATGSVSNFFDSGEKFSG